MFPSHSTDCRNTEDSSSNVYLNLKNISIYIYIFCRKRWLLSFAHRAMCGKPSLQAMCRGVHPSSSLWWISAPWCTSSFTHSRFPDSTASWMAAIPAYTRTERRNQHSAGKKKAFLVGCVGKASLSVLTREVDGVQGDPLGLDETPNPLQLSLAHVILEENVVGEAHAADRLGVFAADCDATVLGVNLESHCLRDGALIVLHSDPCWIFPGVLGELKKKKAVMSSC